MILCCIRLKQLMHDLHILVPISRYKLQIFLSSHRNLHSCNRWRKKRERGDFSSFMKCREKKRVLIYKSKCWNFYRTERWPYLLEKFKAKGNIVLGFCRNHNKIRWSLVSSHFLLYWIAHVSSSSSLCLFPLLLLKTYKLLYCGEWSLKY